MLSCSIKQFQKRVYDYYAAHGRNLPWRNTDNPYYILVSEIMLQQTQVSRVLGKYPQFIRRFPSIQKLAQASLGDVMRQWQGLGYNRRALSLKKLSDKIISEYRGKIPSDREALRQLPGIGEATSGALCAFAFNLPIAFIETNIRSVFIHHFFSGSDRVSDAQLMPYIERALDRKTPRIWYYALMDYGVYLKAKVSNPNRKSLHYRRQTPFNGSLRQARGAVLALLAARNCVTEHVLFKRLGLKQCVVRRALCALEKEGLIQRDRGIARM
jgi:A/G-specific adenine glycosylase